MAEKRNRRLAAIMFTDIVGYTRMMQTDEKNAIIKVDRHRSVLEALTTKYHGKVIQYFGDGSLSIYDSSVEAVKCALEMQQAYRHEPKVPLRVGIHLGDIVYGDGDIFGDGVNIASRLETLGVPGAIILSEKIFDDIKNHTDFQAASLGAFEFKNVSHPMQVYALTNEGLTVPTAEDVKKGKLKVIPENRKRKRLSAVLSALVLFLLLAVFSQRGQNWMKSVLGIPISEAQIELAVFPFEILGDVKGKDDWEWSLAEIVRTNLAYVEQFRVLAPKTSEIMAEDYKTLGLSAIASKRKTNYLVNATCQMEGEEIVIKPSLVDVKAERQIGLGTFRANFMSNELSDATDTIAEIIARRLQGTLSPEIKEKIRLAPTDSIEAWTLYERSKYHFQKIQLDSAKLLLDRAIAIDSNFAEAYAYRAYVIAWMSNWMGFEDIRRFILDVNKDIDKALSLDKDLALPYYARASLRALHIWDMKGADEDFRKAAELTPSHQNLGANYGWFLNVLKGDSETAYQVLKKEFALDPENQRIRFEYANSCAFSGRKKEAQRVYDGLKDEGSLFGYVDYVMHFADGNDALCLESARGYDRIAMELGVEEVPWELYFEGFIEARKGNRERAMAFLKKLDQYKLKGARHTWGFTFPKAVVYSFLNEKEEAIKYLRESFEERATPIILLNSMGSIFLPNIQDEPGYKHILRDLGWEV